MQEVLQAHVAGRDERHSQAAGACHTGMAGCPDRLLNRIIADSFLLLPPPALVLQVVLGLLLPQTKEVPESFER